MIKNLGGVFGRNPTFQTVQVNEALFTSDKKCAYVETTTGRGVLPSVQVFCNSSATALANTAVAQTAFTSTDIDGTFQLTSLTTYMFDGVYIINTGATGKTVSMGFNLGAATVNSMVWTSLTWGMAAANTPTRAQDTNYFNTAAGGVVFALNTVANTLTSFSGILRVNAAGILTPQITFSVAPGSPTMQIGSYLRLYPIGTNTINFVGSSIILPIPV
jgi:hypothetical protein